MSLRDAYASRVPILEKCAKRIEQYIKENLDGSRRIDRISARSKSLDRFLEKSKKTVGGHAAYKDPLLEIQDQLAARIICLYLEDVQLIRAEILDLLRAVEHKTLEPQGFSDFGYFGWHAILFVPREVTDGLDETALPSFFELQVKTVFQHAWSEAEHDIGYKEFSGQLDSPKKRLIAFAAAQAWGADNAFQSVLSDLSDESEDSI